MKTNFILWLFIGLLHTSCAQVAAPATLPAVGQEAFDQRLQQLLNFTVPVIGVQDLAEAPTDQYLLLDARELAEYNVSHIPGAQFLGYKKPNWESLQTVKKEQPIILYCSVGYRSEKLGEQLKEKGYNQVFNLYGSIFEWANQGHPMVDEMGKSTKKIHTYNRKWSRWVENQTGLEKVW